MIGQAKAVFGYKQYIIVIAFLIMDVSLFVVKVLKWIVIEF